MYRLLNARLRLDLTSIWPSGLIYQPLVAASEALGNKGNNDRRHLFTAHKRQGTSAYVTKPISFPVFINRCYTSDRDLMKEWNPTGENPVTEEGAENFDQEKDNTITVSHSNETIKDKLVLYKDGSYSTIPVEELYSEIRSMNIEQVSVVKPPCYMFISRYPHIYYPFVPCLMLHSLISSCSLILLFSDSKHDWKQLRGCV